MSELTASQPMPPTNARRSEEYWPYLIAACYVLVCTGFVLGNYQNPGGDFGQYITQARNLLWGRPWGHLMEGQPAVLPAYSALLALPTAIFGVNFHAYAALNTLLWAGTALIAYRLFAVKLPGKPLRVAFFVGVLCCPYVVFYQQQANPMLLYTFTIMLALLAVERLLEPSGNSHRWPWLLALLLPAAVRTDSIALFAAVFVFFAIHRQWRLLPWPVVGLALTVALDLSLGYGFGQEPNFATVLELWSGAGSGNDLVSERPGMLAATAFMALGYVEGLGTTALSHEFLAMGPAIPITLGPELQRVMTLPAALLFGLCLLGMVRGRWWDVPTLFFAAHFAMLSLFFLAGAVRVRYVFPLVPLFAFFSLRACVWALRSLTLAFPAALRNHYRTLALLLLATGVVSITMVGAARYKDWPEAHNQTVTAELAEIVDYLAGNKDATTIAFYKPRVLTMLLDGRSSLLPVRRLISVEEAEGHAQRSNALLVVTNTRHYGQPAILSHLIDSSHAEPIFRNEGFVVFRTGVALP